MEAAVESDSKGFLGNLREWADALVIAFVLAMFIRTFVVELFKIPSGSMSPTLLGDFIAEGTALDQQNESHKYILIRDSFSNAQVFRQNKYDEYYTYEGKRTVWSLTPSQSDLLNRDLHREEHHICVNKFAYWFRKPDRGDIIVFKVPFRAKPSTYTRNGHDFLVGQYNRNQGVYVKRCVALGGETAVIDGEGQLLIDGKPPERPEILRKIKYTIPVTQTYEVKVPDDQVLGFGDNSDNSLDGRMWGGIPFKNLRGKAFFRYRPLKKMRFLGQWK